METVLLLADAATQDSHGKVSALGLGWSVTSSPTPPAALVLFMKVPWNLANQKHRLEMRLVDEDGRPAGPGPEGLNIQGEFEVGRPPGLPQGTDIDNAIVLNLPAGLELGTDRGYEWRVEVNGDIVARRQFLVRAKSRTGSV